MNGKYVLKLRFKFNYFLTEVQQYFADADAKKSAEPADSDAERSAHH